MKHLVLLFGSICVLLAGCKATAPVVSVPRNDSVVVRNRLERDSVYVRDSVIVRLKADTVYIERWKSRWRERAVTRTDTVWRDREVVVTLPPERYVPAFYRWCTRVLIVAVVLLTGYLLFRLLVKIYLKR